VNEEKDSFRKKLFFFLCKLCGAFFVVLFWLPYQLYCIALFIYLLPDEWRQARRYDTAPKEVDFCRISEKRVKIHEAAELIRERRHKDGQEESRGGWSPFIARWRNLLREYRSPFWKLGTLEELKMIPRERLIEDIMHSPLGMLPKEKVFVWSIHDRSNTFVGYNPFTQETYRGIPAEVPFSSFSGDPAEPDDEHFVYAVSVRIKEENRKS
jgi:hypothetical protein